MSFFNIGITRSGLAAAEYAIKVTQSNIANANTDGYARQRLELGQMESGSRGVRNDMGSGVSMEQVVRIVDNYLVGQYRGEQSELGYYKEMSTSLSRLEAVFNENTDFSLTGMLTRFYNAFEEASKFPENIAYRQSLIGEAETMVRVINTASDELHRTKLDVDLRVENRIEKVNEITQKIADVNRRISLLGTDNPNSLLDERDRQLNELAKYIEVDVVEHDNFMIDVTANGIKLVMRSQAEPIEGKKDHDDKWSVHSNGVFLRSSRGELMANIELANQTLDRYKGKLDAFASALVAEVNAIHQTGYGLDNDTGLNFFEGIDASSMRLSADVRNNPEKIALSSLTDTPGNADRGEDISSLREANVMHGGTMSITDHFSRFVYEMSNDLNIAKSNETVHESMLNRSKELKDNVQAVSIDEEMVSLLNFQRYYQANAKMLNSINQTFDTLISVLR